MVGKKILEKRLRMTLDFEVEVEELTDEALRDFYRSFTNLEEMVRDPEMWANMSRQIRLQRALLEDEEALKKYLTYVVAVEVDGNADSRVAEVFGVGGERVEEETFGPLFAKLGPEDEKFFLELSEENLLYDNTEGLAQSFRVHWVGSRLEEVRSMAEGAMDALASNNSPRDET